MSAFSQRAGVCAVASKNPAVAEQGRGMLMEHFCPWHFLFAFQSVQTFV